jgi:outer membrane protein OmpA-like peptidoglycan-associated protein
MRKLKIIAVIATGMALASCSYYQSGYAPAGEGRISHLLGVATAQNINAQIAYGDPASRIRALNEAFRAAAQDTATFDFDSTALDSSARAALDQQVKWLKANEHVRMTVVGHADRVGTDAYNDRLGLRRARAVVAYLARHGISRGRLDAVESRGRREPVVQTEERERRNRRTVTSVAGFERHYVGDGLDGVYAERVYRSYVSGDVGVAQAAAGS